MSHAVDAPLLALTMQLPESIGPAALCGAAGTLPRHARGLQRRVGAHASYPWRPATSSAAAADGARSSLGPAPPPAPPPPQPPPRGALCAARAGGAALRPQGRGPLTACGARAAAPRPRTACNPGARVGGWAEAASACGRRQLWRYVVAVPCRLQPRSQPVAGQPASQPVAGSLSVASAAGGAAQRPPATTAGLLPAGQAALAPTPLQRAARSGGLAGAIRVAAGRPAAREAARNPGRHSGPRPFPGAFRRPATPRVANTIERRTRKPRCHHASGPLGPRA